MPPKPFAHAATIWRYEIILDRGETPNKCTIAPLAYRSDFTLRRFTNGQRQPPLQSTLLLHPDGPPITAQSAPAGSLVSIAAIDSVWRRVDPILSSIDGDLPALASIPREFKTAYPRRSRLTTADPTHGLATIEALFTAAALLGHWDPGLLSEYFFGSQFVALNREAFELHGIHAVDTLPPAVYRPRLPRNSATRRISRGRKCAGNEHI